MLDQLILPWAQCTQLLAQISLVVFFSGQALITTKRKVQAHVHAPGYDSHFCYHPELIASFHELVIVPGLFIFDKITPILGAKVA